MSFIPIDTHSSLLNRGIVFALLSRKISADAMVFADFLSPMDHIPYISVERHEL